MIPDAPLTRALFTTAYVSGGIGLLFLLLAFLTSIPAMFSAAVTPPALPRCANATDLTLLDPSPDQPGKDYSVQLHADCWSGWITTPRTLNWSCEAADPVVPEIQLPDGRRFPDTARVSLSSHQSFRVRGVGLYLCSIR